MNYELRIKNIIRPYLKAISYKLKATAGFTLIEMMVALSIFTVVMTVALGSLLTLIDANKKAQALQTITTNLNYVIDDISRNARVGGQYRCANSNNLSNLDTPKDCSDGKGLLAFLSTSGDRIVYRLSDGHIEKSANGGATFVQVTSNEIDVLVLRFYVSGSSAGDSEQPRVVISMSGTIGQGASYETDFNIQTSITERIIDF